MSNHKYESIEKILIKASMERERIHWAKIFANSPEFLGKKEKQEVVQIADRWGVTIIGK